MSSFDDEFGLFGEESDEAERRPTLGARKIASNETIIDDVEPEVERPARAERPQRGGGGYDKPRRSGGGNGGGGRRGGYERRDRQPQDPWAASRKATALLDFVAKKLVAKPEEASVELFTDEDGKPVIELVVDSEDLGKVIGRNGRVAQALRTIVRATAEGRISVDILDKEEAESFDEGEGDEE
ncbi:MAG TPA: KH domain-containing protein [Candidatus Aquilonibacter sp.]|nr:KH domain-containing protein [Candidatus Aquilonibacter sp.]